MHSSWRGCILTMQLKPAKKKTPGPNGAVAKYKHEYYYTCDLSMGDKKKMKQSKLSFTKATKKTTQE